MTMLEQRAEVIGIAAGQLTLRPLLRLDCPRCAAGNGCGAQLFSSSEKNASPLQVPMTKELSVECGDIVVIGMAPRLLQRAALWLYGLPLLVMLVTVAFASSLGLSEGVQVLLMTFALVASFWLVQQRAHRLTRQPTLKLLRKESNAACEPVRPFEPSSPSV